MNYYNDNDKGAVKWIKYLIKNKLIPDGKVDDRDIREIKPSDLEGFIQHHFFCGIAGWPYALRLAGWPEDKPVFTGSCPCQPFSVAGKGAGVEDERHLWPAFRWLIAQYRPGIVFGEQVSGKAGREWFDGVSADLEAINYEVGAADLPACSVGAPHIRQRLWWVAHSEHSKRRQETTTGNNDNGQDTGRQETAGGFISCSAINNGLAYTPCKRQHGAAGMPEQDRRDESEAGCGLGYAESSKKQWLRKHKKELRRSGKNRGPGYWNNYKWIECRDGKQRRIPPEPALFPLANGLPGRVAALRGIGNAIVPQIAAEFIRAYMNYENIR